MAAEALLGRRPTLGWAPKETGLARLGGLLRMLRRAAPIRSARAIDLCQTDREYTVRIALPAHVQGVEIPIGHEVLRVAVRGARPRRFLRLRERPYGWFLRSVALPPGLPLDALRAELRDGTLEIRIPA